MWHMESFVAGAMSGVWDTEEANAEWEAPEWPPASGTEEDLSGRRPTRGGGRAPPRPAHSRRRTAVLHSLQKLLDGGESKMCRESRDRLHPHRSGAALAIENLREGRGVHAEVTRRLPDVNDFLPQPDGMCALHTPRV